MNNKLNALLSDAPVLLEIFRGHGSLGEPIIECAHRGLIVISDSEKMRFTNFKDGSTQIHMRSCGKPFQVLPLLRTGFFDAANRARNGVSESDLALLMSSHSGQPLHTTRVAQLLKHLGLDEAALRCGIHPPTDEKTRNELIKNSIAPSVLHNNCSGKHVGMLASCLALGYDLLSYENPQHPLQQAIKSDISKLSGVALEDLAYGIDGCSLPSFALPISSVALMYARLAYFQHHPQANFEPFLPEACKKIWHAACTYPEFIAGDGHFDTELMRACGGQIFSKSGADGIQALAVLPCEQFKHGLGIVIKIVDGDGRNMVRPIMVRHVLQQLSLWPKSSNLDPFFPSFKNLRSLTTGGFIVHQKI